MLPPVALLRAVCLHVGGTGEFAAASGSFGGELSGSATLARNPDGSCSQDTSRIETTEITSTGTLSF